MWFFSTQAFVKIKVLDGPVRGGLSVICWGPEEVTALQVKASDITKIACQIAGSWGICVSAVREGFSGAATFKLKLQERKGAHQGVGREERAR